MVDEGLVRHLREWIGGDAGWRQTGTDPDYRFSLANERTFLSWMRTALAIMAGAIGVVQLVPTHHLLGSRRALGILLAALGLAISASAYRRWASNERAMRNGEPLPRSSMLIILSGVLAAVAVIVLVVVIFA